MTNEIKIVLVPIDQAISSLKESVQSVQASIPSEIKGNNQLGFLERVSAINGTYRVTETTIEKIEEMDESLANFSFFKGD